jgi:hypothetical protein
MAAMSTLSIRRRHAVAGVSAFTKGGHMVKARQLLASVILFGLAGVSVAQSTDSSSSQDNDARVQSRKEKAEARKAYKSGQISKKEYDQARRDANSKLRSSGSSGPVNAAEQDLSNSGPQPKSSK